MIFDISRSISSDLAQWPGDTSFSFDWQFSKRAGDSVNVASMHLSSQAGTHVESRLHIADEGQPVSDLPLDRFVGLAYVVDKRGQQTIALEDHEIELAGKLGRLLVRTDAWVDDRQFPQIFPILTEQSAQLLVQTGCMVFGIDVPSADAVYSKAMPIHHTLLGYGCVILESLDLTNVETGVYGFVALPLPIVGTEASPTRVILTHRSMFSMEQQGEP